jgi:hypothetical protein
MMKLSFEWLYKNWAWISIILALYLMLVLLTFVNDNNYLLFLIWLQVPVYLLHQFEEHAWPGGFKRYINRNIFNAGDREAPLDDAGIFWINIPIVWALMPLCAILSRYSLVIGAWIPFFSVINSLTHVLVLLAKREYNPGAVVSLLVNIPVGAYTIVALYNAGAITVLVGVLSIAFAILLHLAIIVYMRSRSTTKTGHGGHSPGN